MVIIVWQLVVRFRAVQAGSEAVQKVGGGVELGRVEQLAGQYPGGGGGRRAGGSTRHHKAGVIEKD